MQGIGIDSKKFFAEVKNTEELVKESIKRILLTRPFERPNRPNFGIGIEKFLFSNISSISQFAIDEIKEQLKTFEPRIIVDKVSFERQGENGIKIIISYRVRENYLENQSLEINLGV